jgi:N-methylhydantoinase A
VRIRELFEEEHRSRYGYARATLKVEVVGYRVRVIREMEDTLLTPMPTGNGPDPENVLVTIGGDRVAAQLIAREWLRPGACLDGPAIIEEGSATTFVPRGWLAECLPTGDLMLRDFR